MITANINIKLDTDDLVDLTPELVERILTGVLAEAREYMTHNTQSTEARGVPVCIDVDTEEGRTSFYGEWSCSIGY